MAGARTLFLCAALVTPLANAVLAKRNLQDEGLDARVRHAQEVVQNIRQQDVERDEGVHLPGLLAGAAGPILSTVSVGLLAVVAPQAEVVCSWGGCAEHQRQELPISREDEHDLDHAVAPRQPVLLQTLQVVGDRLGDVHKEAVGLLANCECHRVRLVWRQLGHRLVEAHGYERQHDVLELPADLVTVAADLDDQTRERGDLV